MKNYITTYSLIRNQSMMIDHKPFMSSDETSVNDFYKALYHKMQMEYPKFHKMDLMAKSGILGSEFLCRDITSTYHPDEIAIIFSNKSSSSLTDHKHKATINDKAASFPSPAIFVYTLPNIVNGEIAIKHNIQGENNFFISNAFNAEELISQIEMTLDFGQSSCCLAGWIEAGENTCDTFIFLVEKKPHKLGLLLTTENLNKLYNHNE